MTTEQKIIENSYTTASEVGSCQSFNHSAAQGGNRIRGILFSSFILLPCILAAFLFVAGCSSDTQKQETDAAWMGNTQNRAVWMQKARWGVMTHFLADWIAQENNIEMSVEKWNELVDNFDVEGLAKQLESVGAGYYLITIGQNSGYFLSPNTTYDRHVGIKPSKCSRRDLVADLYKALNKRGIKLMTYLPSHPSHRDRVASKALNWKGSGRRDRTVQLIWEQVIREWSVRWGDKVVGWWFDGCYRPNLMYRFPEPPNFASFAASARAGNPDSVVAFNQGAITRIFSLTPYEDYTAGETNNPDQLQIMRVVDGKIDGAQVQILSYLGRTWGKGKPRFSTEQVVKWSKDIRKKDGVITWDVPVGTNGLMSQSFMDQLTAVGKALARP